MRAGQNAVAKAAEYMAQGLTHEPLTTNTSADLRITHKFVQFEVILALATGSCARYLTPNNITGQVHTLCDAEAACRESNSRSVAISRKSKLCFSFLRKCFQLLGSLHYCRWVQGLSTQMCRKLDM
jgi:hypothetical protein